MKQNVYQKLVSLRNEHKDLYPSVHSCFIPAQLEITQMSIDIVNG